MSFYVVLNINGNMPFMMCVNEEMIFKEFVNIFYQNSGLNEDSKPTFFFNSNPINSNSINKLKDFGIKAGSVIEIRTEKPLNMSNYQMLMNMQYYEYMNMAQNMNMFQYMNMLPKMNMGQNSQNQNIENTEVDKKEDNCANIIVYFNDNKIIIQISTDKKISEFAQRFCNKTGIREKPIFILNSKVIYPRNNNDHTLKDLGIGNNSKIDAVFYSQIVGA